MAECVCVLGMHRSGTSCLTGIMQEFGVELGEVFTQNPHNKRGNRENSLIMELNNDVLAYNGGAWDQPVIVDKWAGEHLGRRDAIIDAISSQSRLYWGFKDPRTLLTLPFWLDAGIRPRFVGTFRHPLRVATSLNTRDPAFSIDIGLRLWLEYNRRMVAIWKVAPFLLVNFDLPDQTYLDAVATALLRVLGSDFSSKALQAQAFFAQELRSQIGLEVDDALLPPDVAHVYNEIKFCNLSGWPE